MTFSILKTLQKNFQIFYFQIAKLYLLTVISYDQGYNLHLMSINIQFFRTSSSSKQHSISISSAFLWGRTWVLMENRRWWWWVVNDNQTHISRILTTLSLSPNLNTQLSKTRRINQTHSLWSWASIYYYLSITPDSRSASVLRLSELSFPLYRCSNQSPGERTISYLKSPMGLYYVHNALTMLTEWYHGKLSQPICIHSSATLTDFLELHFGHHDFLSDNLFNALSLIYIPNS